MAPKKLTDCPENLRESIDWLIQVRHGNDNGLGELAKAVKKLIDEATTSATKSLTTREDQLNCPIKSSDKSTRDQSNCHKLQSEIDCDTQKLKDLKSKSTDDSKKKEIDDLNAKIKKAEASKNDCAKTHHLSKEERDKGLEEVQQQREIVDKLQKFKDSLNNDSNNILNNLCTGLEKFLGFNSASKGYDGTGIVYSDLDRLCDGVMGFLSGVLSAVKNENEVITYDKYIMPETNRLESVLTKLTSSIGTGRNGLAVSVRAVKRWLEGYEREVNEKINEVKNPIDELKSEISKDIVKINEEKDDPLFTQIGQWRNRAGGYLARVVRSENVLKNVDETLKNKLSCKIEMLKQATQTFEEAAKNDDLNVLYDLAGTKMNIVTEYAKEKFHEKSRWLQWYLRKEIRALENKLLKLQSHEFKELAECVNTNLQDAFDKVDIGILKLEKRYETDTVPSLRKLRDMALAIKTLAETEKSTLKQEVEKLSAQIASLGTVKSQVNPPNEHLNGYQQNNEWKLTDRIDGVLQEIEKNVKSHFKTILEDINGQVRMINGHVGEKTEVPVVVADPNNTTLYHNWEALKGDITDHVKVIKGQQGRNLITNGKGLKQINEGIINYAKGFGNGKFLNELKKWAKNIVDEGHGQVDRYIIMYVNSKGHGTDLTYNNGKRGAEAVRDALKDQLPVIVGGTIQQAADHADLKNAEVKNIGSKLGTFAERIAETTETETYVASAARVIEGALGLSQTGNRFLAQAIKHCLKCISVTANNLAVELQSFLQMSDLDANLSHVSSKVDAINEHVCDKTPGYTNGLGNKIDKALSEMKRTLTSLDTDITEATEHTGTDTGSLRPANGTVGRKVGEIKDKATGDKFNNELKNLVTAAVHKGIEELQKKVSAIIDDHLTVISKTLAGIRNHDETTAVSGALVKGRSTLTRDASSLHSDIQQFFENEVGMTADSKGTVFNDIRLIKTDIVALSENVAEARKRVSAVSEQLHHCIQDSNTLLINALKETEKSFSQLRYDIEGKIERGFKSVQEKAKDLYAARKRNELTELHTLINGELTEVNKIIRHDQVTGLKGLLTRLSHNFVNNVTNIKDVQPTSQTSPAATPETDPPKKCPLVQAVKHLITGVNAFSDSFLSQAEILSVVNRVTPVTDSLKGLLKRMEKSEHHHHKVVKKCDEFDEALDKFKPETMDDARKKVLTPLKKGFGKFVYELGKQYVNKYSGEIYAGDLVKNKTSSEPKTVIPPAKPGDKTEITEYGRKCAKVFLTCLATLCDGLKPLKTYSIKYSKHDQINKSTTIGDFLSERGYVVAAKDDHDAELQNAERMRGFHIHKILDNNVATGEATKHLQTCTDVGSERDETLKHTGTKSQFSVVSILKCLFSHLHHYYAVCHFRHIERPKSPSSVYQMLVWLTGLSHNRVYSRVSVSDIAQLFEKPDAESGEGNIENPPILDKDPDTLEAYPQPIAASMLTSTIHKVCVAAEDVLTSILGHGHADGIYAVDFDTNPDGFSYPTAPGACFDMLCDVLNRLYQQLFFLYGQCINEEPSVSWRDCWYGNLVGGSAWSCNTMQCPDQKGNQIHKQKCHQNCNQAAECGIKSPLQSFLEDGLPGFLPHQFSSPSCKLKCSVSNHNGIPCKSPMGFRNIGTAASHRKTGQNITDVLAPFCGPLPDSLSLLCSCLLLIPRRPPQTLCEMFTFYHNYLENWQGGWRNLQDVNKHKNNAFQRAINSANFEREYTKLNPSTIFATSSHDKHIVDDKNNLTGDLFSLSTCKYNEKSVVPCGRYLQPLSLEARCLFNEKQASHYLSWIVYLTETFYALLSKMLDECCRKCGAGGSNCHAKCCADTCKARNINKDTKRTEVAQAKHDSACSSIVNCHDTHATMYAYGFTFGSPYEVSGCKGAEWKRTCKDFCDALKEVLDEDSLLIKLIASIEEFMWTIREPFSYLVLALWSASFLYLLYVYIGRLDTLHIRSHLRIPSSHKIAAQSLLAAARIGKLAKISYLQP